MSDGADEEKDEVVDVVVIGSGVGGMTAAIVAALDGLDAVVLEKTACVGGSTAYAAGGAWLPGNHLVPPEDDPAAPVTYLANCIGNRMDRAMVDAYLANGPKALKLLEERTSVAFEPQPGGDYRSDVPGASAKTRTVLPKAFDARVLGKHRHLLRRPLASLTLFNGMQATFPQLATFKRALNSPRAMATTVATVGRHYRDLALYRRPVRLVYGNALAGRLLKSALDLGIPVRTGAAAWNLLVEDGRVVGLRYRIGDAVRTVRARRGVVLAGGGYPGDAAMRRAHASYPDHHKSVPPTTNTGDGARMAIAVGARMGESLSDYCLTPVSVAPDGKGGELRYPHFLLDRCLPGAIVVGADGRRFVREAIDYHRFTLAMQDAGAVPAYLICDHRFLRRHGLGMVRPAPFPLHRWIADGYLIKASTLADLAQRLGIDAAGLSDTVTRNNGFAETGKDLDFGKGDDPYGRALGDPTHNGPNPCLGPIGVAPFYAIRLYPGDTATTQGLEVDPQARVLDAERRAIPGLFAVGADMHNPTLGANPSAGCNIGCALAFGYAAARTMADAAAS